MIAELERVASEINEIIEKNRSIQASIDAGLERLEAFALSALADAEPPPCPPEPEARPVSSERPQPSERLL